MREFKLPDPFVSHNGVKVYHCYNVVAGKPVPAMFTFTLDPLDLKVEHGFHVLILAQILSMEQGSERFGRTYHRQVLKVFCSEPDMRVRGDMLQTAREKRSKVLLSFELDNAI